MALFDQPITNYDWTGDGKIDSWDDCYYLSMVNMQLQEEAREDRISRIVRAITADGVAKTIGNAEFDELCRSIGLRMSDFEQRDIDEIQRRLDRW